MMQTTYHVQYRYGFVGDYQDPDRIVTDCRDAVIYSRIGALSKAGELNTQIGELDRPAQAVMLTSTGRVQRIFSR